MKDNVTNFNYFKQQKAIRKMDLAASFESLNTCLKMLGINSLSENETIKKQIKIAMKKLEVANK